MQAEKTSELLPMLNTDTRINGFHDGKHDFLSNFYDAPVRYNGILYPTREHAYQAQKSGNNRVQQIFAKLDTPQEAKTLGRAIRVREDWDTIKDLVMFNIVYACFTQNPELALKLVETGNRELIEDNHWNDTYWGVCNGEGQNKLGKILMQVRDRLNLSL